MKTPEEVPKQGGTGDKKVKVISSGTNGKKSCTHVEQMRNDIAQMYKEHIRNAEWDCFEAKQKCDWTRINVLAKHVDNMKRHGLDGFAMFLDHGSYAFVTLCSEEEADKSDEESTVSALSTGADKQEVGKYV